MEPISCISTALFVEDKESDCIKQIYGISFFVEHHVVYENVNM